MNGIIPCKYECYIKKDDFIDAMETAKILIGKIVIHKKELMPKKQIIINMINELIVSDLIKNDEINADKLDIERERIYDIFVHDSNFDNVWTLFSTNAYYLSWREKKGQQLTFF